MRARSSPAPAEAVRAVSTLCRSSFGRGGAVLRSLHGLALAVHVGAVVRAFGLLLCGVIAVTGGGPALRGRRLCSEQLQRE